jgi:hypothetical protein
MFRCPWNGYKREARQHSQQAWKLCMQVSNASHHQLTAHAVSQCTQQVCTLAHGAAHPRKPLACTVMFAP